MVIKQQAKTMKYMF